MKLLNPVLYRLLCHRYGEQNVEVVSGGVPITWSLSRQRIGQDIKLSRDVEDSGEEFRLRCPLCKDHRPRLYVNHRWGVYDEATKNFNLWLAHCFNEECFTDYESQAWFRDQVYGRRPRNIRIAQAREPEGGHTLREIRPPGPLWRIDKLAADHPHHQAVLYLQERHYDLKKLGHLWRVAYCPSSIYRLASNRIIIPMYQDDMMVGWQARYIGDDVNGVPFNVAGVPKYWSSKGFKRRLVAYNFEQAVRHRTVVIVEGMTDVWNVGPMAIGLLGKTMSPFLRKKLVRMMKDRHGDKGVVVIMLDPELDKQDKKKKRDHPIKRLHKQLISRMPGRIVPVKPPDGYDPGSMDRVWVRRLIREKAEERNIQVTFAKPKV